MWVVFNIFGNCPHLFYKEVPPVGFTSTPSQMMDCTSLHSLNSHNKISKPYIHSQTQWKHTAVTPQTSDPVWLHNWKQTRMMIKNLPCQCSNQLLPFVRGHLVKSILISLRVGLLYKTHLLMGPNLENIISKSWSWVTGFNLQTNRTLSGGLISASGISPTWKTSYSNILIMRK